MEEFIASKGKGKELIRRASTIAGYYLDDIYRHPSKAKIESFNYIKEYLYARTENAKNFHITSFNVNHFSCAWDGTKNGEKILRLETDFSSYLVWLER